jgi:8-oxo-dGTP pyrophosphatase MutT (NUDIX family)
MAIKLFNVGIKAAIIKDDKLLLVKHTAGYWDFPGGRIDDDESIEETLRREISEELPNAKLNAIGEVITSYRIPGDVFDDGRGLVLIVYRVDAEFPDGNVEISEEHTEVWWATFDEAYESGSQVARETVNSLRR